MKYAFFLGCTTPYRLKGYELSSRVVLENLGVELEDIPAFNCCGYPFRNVDEKSFLLASARNFALAKRQDLHMLVLCKCGYGTMKKAAHLLTQDPALNEEINVILAKEGLHCDPGIKISHLLTVLRNDVGLDSMGEKITRQYQDLKIATHYGCHALRPSDIVEFDDPVAPAIFDELVALTGAESIEWPNKLECCGGPLYDVNEALSVDLTCKKMGSAKKAGAHYLTTACPFCQIQFETVKEENPSENISDGGVPSVLYPQLLGLTMGIDGHTLGMGSQLCKEIESYFASQESDRKSF
jgi:heterodisulfide reductase subunit B